MSDFIREEELLRRAVAGDGPALDGLMARYCRRLSGYIAPRLPADLRGTLEVEDVLQEISMEVFRTIGTLEGADAKSFWGWLCRLAEHRLRDLVRAGRAAKRGGERIAVDAQSDSVACLLEQVAVTSRTPSMSAARHEAASAVLAALDRIPEDYRLALRLRYLEGLAPAEIAARMGRKEGSVRLLCHRGLKQLAEALGPESHFLTRKG